MFARTSLFTLAALATATPLLAEEVNVYSLRQPELVQPLFDALHQGNRHRGQRRLRR